jgi:glycosyltransferase involved in cell wall biosynthesis
VLHNLGYFVEAMTAGRYMEAQGLQHFHTHFSSTVALLLSKVFPLTFSATIHGPEEFDNAKGFYLAEKVAAGRFFCTISQYSRSQLMRASQPEHWDKLEVAPLGVDPESFTPRPHRAQPNRFEILSVGRLAPAKAHAILLRAIAILVRQGHANLRLRIAGGGPDYALLSQQIVNLGLQEHAFLLGPCPQDQVRQLYRETDLFALASFAEGVPVVLMEAMAMEIPCLSTWVMGIPELIQHGESGWLVPPSEPQLLAEGIAHLMSDPELRQRLGQQGRVQVQKNYNLTANTALLREILTRRLSRESAVPPLKE